MRKIIIIVDHSSPNAPNNMHKEIRFLSDLYCPFCGKKTVYDENDTGDYYHGTQLVCISCDQEFSIAKWSNECGGENGQRARLIREKLNKKGEEE